MKTAQKAPAVVRSHAVMPRNYNVLNSPAPLLFSSSTCCLKPGLKRGSQSEDRMARFRWKLNKGVMYVTYYALSSVSAILCMD